MNEISKFMNNNNYYFSIIVEFLIIKLTLLIKILLLEISYNFFSQKFIN